MTAIEPAVTISEVSYAYPESSEAVFSDLTLELPPGVITLVGQNGIGKSTLLLLAGGRILPDSGLVSLLGTDTRSIADEEERNRLASFIYQNMEFETEDPVDEIMAFVLENGFHKDKNPSLIRELSDVLELGEFSGRQLHKLAKGEMQRAILAFSLLYGSRLIVMDEPMFAMEDPQKKRAMDFLVRYAREYSTSIYYSVHELELSMEYSDYVALFYRDGRIVLGATPEILTDSNLEEAYEFPRGMLYQKEQLFREVLLRHPSYTTPSAPSEEA